MKGSRSSVQRRSAGRPSRRMLCSTVLSNPIHMLLHVGLCQSSWALPEHTPLQDHAGGLQSKGDRMNFVPGKTVQE